MLELPPDFQISPIFNVSDLYLLDGFTGETIYTEDQVEQLPKAKPCVEDGLDIKEGVIQERQLVQAILTEVATQTN